MPYGRSTGRFSASRFGAFHYRQDWIINQTGGEGGGEGLRERKPVLVDDSLPRSRR